MQTVDISLQWDDTLTQQKGIHQYSQFLTTFAGDVCDRAGE